jgi:predicted nucleic acid-binding protein
VVADSGPLIHLAQAGQISLLRAIFKEVLIVSAVKREVIDEGVRQAYPDAKFVADALAEGYIVVHRISSRNSKRASKLSKQERISQSDSETLILAQTLRKPLLTDEKLLSKLAKMYGLEVWNTWTVLLEALRQELIDKERIHGAIQELGERRHKLSARSAKEILDAAERITAPKTA